LVIEFVCSRILMSGRKMVELSYNKVMKTYGF